MDVERLIRRPGGGVERVRVVADIPTPHPRMSRRPPWYDAAPAPATASAEVQEQRVSSELVTVEAEN
jgi:hypothetical protein